MRSKKIILILIIILLSIAGITYYIYTKEDKNTTLNLLEKQWIEKNKNNIIDMGILSDVPIFTEGGNGLFFDFLGSLGDETGLSFNYVPYSGEKSESTYSFSVVDSRVKGDILVYSDNYVLVGRENSKAFDAKKLKKGTIAIINADLDKVNNYIDSDEVLFKTFDTYEKAMEAFMTPTVVGNETEGTEASVNELDYIAIPKVIYMKFINENGYFINYQITEMNKHYVIRLGKENRLNDILTKYYKKWSSDNYDTVFSDYFSKSYFKYNLINEKESVNFRSKSYTYGYIDNLPYEFVINGTIYGSTINLLEEFSRKVDIEINYLKYKNVDALKKAFADKKIDFMINYEDLTENTSTSIHNRDYVVVSKSDRNIIVNSLNSLVNREVSVLKDSFAEKLLIAVKAKVKTYDNVDTMVSKASDKSILFMDRDAYDVYQNNKLKGFKTDYIVSLGNYNFILRDITNNKVFNDYLNFFLSFDNYTNINNAAKLDIIENYGQINVKLGLYISVGLFFLISALTFSLVKYSKRNVKKPKSISKEDKLKYIDMLTSLKNRNYLNDNLEKWDSSEVYPQAILVIDLNNVAYINDNYGHAEGDNVIREAANTLIMTQESGSDIIRTSGNEFLIYLVGHDEKSVVAYKRKLAKEFKDLSHSFGAAIGYSMILDGIKTIDDAINEATLDMRNNKESQNN